MQYTSAPGGGYSYYYGVRRLIAWPGIYHKPFTKTRFDGYELSVEEPRHS